MKEISILLTMQNLKATKSVQFLISLMKIKRPVPDNSELLLSKFILNLEFSTNISNEKLKEILEQMLENVANS